MKMKKMLFVLLVFAMTVVGCDDAPTNKKPQIDDTPQTVKYESVDAAGYTYILTITGKTSRAAYTVTKGDSYILTIKQPGQPDKESKGVVSTIKGDGEFTMKPTKADSVPFGVNVSSGKMTAINGTITLEDGNTIIAPGVVTPVGSGSDGNVGGTFTSIEDMEAWLSSKPANTADTPYAVKLNVSDLGGDVITSGSVGYALSTKNDKYVNLDLSDATFTIIWYSFSGCTSLISVNIPDSVTSIGYCAFEGCTSLSNITIGNSVTTIGDYAFEGCTSLSNITIGNSVTTIGDYAFYQCTSLTSVTIGNSVTSIGDYAFYGCTSLSNITIGNSVTSIGDYAFYQCTNLTSVTFQGTITSSNFISSAFYQLGDLRAKYLAGGIGTYTTTAPVKNNSVWTKK